MEGDNRGREYRYQKDWTSGTLMFHVRCDDFDEFKVSVENMEKLIPKPGFPDDTGPIATPKQAFQAPVCEVHGIPMTLKPAGVSRAGKPYPAFWSCSQKNPDGTYCSYKPK